MIAVPCADPRCAWPAPDLAHDVQPILVCRCLICRNASLSHNGVRFDGHVAALAAGDAGSVIVAGNSARPEFIRRVSSGKKGIAKVRFHELPATTLHCLGFDHMCLTHRRVGAHPALSMSAAKLSGKCSFEPARHGGGARCMSGEARPAHR